VKAVRKEDATLPLIKSHPYWAVYDCCDVNITPSSCRLLVRFVQCCSSPQSLKLFLKCCRCRHRDFSAVHLRPSLFVVHCLALLTCFSTVCFPAMGFDYFKVSLSNYCQVKPSFVIFDIRALWRSALSVRVPGCQKLQMTYGLTRSGTKDAL